MSLKRKLTDQNNHQDIKMNYGIIHCNYFCLQVTGFKNIFEKWVNLMYTWWVKPRMSQMMLSP